MRASAPSTEPIRRPTLGAEVTDRLRELVIGGAFAPGTILSEVDLAARFGVSRGPVREALLHLLQEGLLRREPRRGVSVPVVGEDDIADLHLARHALEAEALRIVLERRPGGLDAELAAVLSTMTDAVARGDWTAVADCDITFHAVIVRAAGSPRLIRMWSGLVDETRAHLSATHHHVASAEIVREHAEIAALLGLADQPNLLAAVTAHIARRPGRSGRRAGAPVRRRTRARQSTGKSPAVAQEAQR
jgi:DNA-binding GntR family transcriptional regulator